MMCNSIFLNHINHGKEVLMRILMDFYANIFLKNRI